MFGFKFILIFIFLGLLFQETPLLASLTVQHYAFNTFVNLKQPAIEDIYPQTLQNLNASTYKSNFRVIDNYTNPAQHVLLKSSIGIASLMTHILTKNGLKDASHISPALVGLMLNYPNPFSADASTEIGYELSTAMDVEIHIYNVLGHRILKKVIASGDPGGVSGPNLVPFSSADTDGFRLSAGIYLYFLVHGGDVLGKGKMAVVP